MTADRLMVILSKLDPATPVMILDSSNGGGHPREINLGPVERVITKEDEENSIDCNGMVGETVYVIGFGSY